MAFDAGMLSCVLHEIKEESLGARVEKVYQPERDEIILQIRSKSGGKRLLINAGANNPRIGFTSIPKENPQNPPMLCMLLRKHLQGAKLISVEQFGFERAAILGFETRDEMGYECVKYLIAELMGKYSNLIFADGDMKIVTALKIIDFSTSSLRQVLPGMKYELPPKQDKADPMETDEAEFTRLMEKEPLERGCDKFILGNYLGISAAIAREIAFSATGAVDTPISKCSPKVLWSKFSELIQSIKSDSYAPTLILDGEKPVEYAFCPLNQYRGLTAKSINSPSELLDLFFDSRDKEQRVKQRASDVQKILLNAHARLTKKIELQEGELAECANGESYKKTGDLITANIYMLKRGMKSADLPDYDNMKEDGTFPIVTVVLDERLSPAANAQRLYQKYNKSKNAKIELTKQIELAQKELEYINSVLDSLDKAESPADLAEIRDELWRSGYASKMKGYTSHKQSAPAVATFVTSGGYTVLCGKNNIQNEYITFKLGSKTDYWFHAKNAPGSHVVMLTGGEEPPAEDFTEAAEIAAYHSKAFGGQSVEVDYTFIRHVKKPPAAKPGFVIYHTNWSALVTPNPEKIHAMRKK
ncbi:MAG: NFACT family protein [Clostridia bacterium]|nr:NFACT family protein [Clostridia bacterium]